MVFVRLAFELGSNKWTHQFEVAHGSTILDLKEKIVARDAGTKEDRDSFEFQRDGCRVPDYEVIKEDVALKFRYLGAEDGSVKAREDADALKQQSNTAVTKSVGEVKPAVSELDRPKVSSSVPEASLPSRTSSVTPGPAPASTNEIRWEIVGGADTGGIIVRSGRDLASPKLPERLAHQAIVVEVERAGDRLQYSKVSGSGPSQGWISIRVTQKELARQLK
mmetsp:Transcript_44528/g.105526  ORF Transcript_44528/g.105526 Transcript_44528/m.105526 type:complete len:221 (+) Transcript_44528:104-766(+)